MEDNPSFLGFGGIGEESVGPGAKDNGEVFREKVRVIYAFRPERNLFSWMRF